MKLLLIILCSLSLNSFAKNVKCELTRHDRIAGIPDTLETTVHLELRRRGCIDAYIADTDYGRDRFTYEICKRGKTIKIEVFRGGNNFGRRLWKQPVVKQEYKLYELEAPQNIMNNISISCE